MNIEPLIPTYAIFLISLVAGLLLGFVSWKLFKAGVRRAAQSEADEILQEVKDAAELRLLEEKEKTQEIEMDAWTKNETELLKLEEKIEDLEEIAKEKKQKLDDIYSQVRQKTVDHENEVKAEEKVIQDKEAALNQLKNRLNSINTEYIEKLSQRTGVSKDNIQKEIIEALIQETKNHNEKYIEHVTEEAKEHSETMAKSLIDKVISRFQRPYCSERGISGVYFEDPSQRRILCDAKGDNIKTISELTGCDIVVADDMEIIGVAGFDPVRRELTRRILERCLKERNPVTPDFIKRAAENIKRELLSLIKKDGDQLAKELGLQNLHPEIRQMMGSLRFRYSFTQNQYFHCGEVGWMAGLFASELGTVPIRKARRAGMLHDLGKSMDHELDGGHAVIGANFIEARGEDADIVKAVRSHHFDQQPDCDLDYLVIAADAISGSRPGARRSTIESYAQKINELQDIARSFDGVTDCYVLNGGRECRVMVNGKKVDDMTSLKLSSEIAKRIEGECNYPGQIKVVVVRETITFETTASQRNY